MLLVQGIKEGKIDHDEIIHEISVMTGISIEQLSQKQASNLKTLEEKMKLQVFGQDKAINAITDKILVARAGLKSLTKPVGSFLFLGPTGCGKTETARQLKNTPMLWCFLMKSKKLTVTYRTCYYRLWITELSQAQTVRKQIVET